MNRHDEDWRTDSPRGTRRSRKSKVSWIPLECICRVTLCRDFCWWLQDKCRRRAEGEKEGEGTHCKLNLKAGQMGAVTVARAPLFHPSWHFSSWPGQTKENDCGQPPGLVFRLRNLAAITPLTHYPRPRARFRVISSASDRTNASSWAPRVDSPPPELRDFAYHPSPRFESRGFRRLSSFLSSSLVERKKGERKVWEEMWTEETGVHRRSQENVAMERAEDQLLDGTTNVQGIISIRYEYTYHYCLILITSIQIYK